MDSLDMSSQLLFSSKSRPGDSPMCLNLLVKRLFCTWARVKGELIPLVRSQSAQCGWCDWWFKCFRHIFLLLLVLGSSFLSSKTLSSRAVETRWYMTTSKFVRLSALNSNQTPFLNLIWLKGLDSNFKGFLVMTRKTYSVFLSLRNGEDKDVDRLL